MTEPDYPEKEFRAGRVSAACWKSETIEEGRGVTKWNIRVQKRYNQAGEWRSTDYFFASELADLILVAQHALAFVRLRESEKNSDLPPGGGVAEVDGGQNAAPLVAEGPRPATARGTER